MAGAGAGAGAQASERAQEQELIQWKDTNPMEGTDLCMLPGDVVTNQGGV